MSTKILRILVLLPLACLASGAWFETAESREASWKKDPWMAFRRDWYFHHFEDYPQQVRETTMLRVRKAEIDQGVMRTEAKIGKDKQQTEWRTLKYSVRRAGLNKDGLPCIEIVLTDTGSAWNAVFLPKEKRCCSTRTAFLWADMKTKIECLILL